jgi:hypothetical protein
MRMMSGMDNSDVATFSIECTTCVATGTTACNECVVTHLLANDDGPIDLVTVPVGAPMSAIDRTIALFQRAGLLDDPVQFVEHGVFDDVEGRIVVPVP